MNIDLKKFFSSDNASRSVEHSFSMKDIEVDGCFPFISPVSVTGTLKSFAGSAELDVEISFEFLLPCNRCMEDYPTSYKLKMQHTLVRGLGTEDHDSFIQVENDVLDLDELIYSDIILSLPAKYICKEDCKGICPTCGINLNQKSCECSKGDIDSRLEALKSLIEE